MTASSKNNIPSTDEMKQSLKDIWDAFNCTGRPNNSCFRKSPQELALMELTNICFNLVETVDTQAQEIKKLRETKKPRNAQKTNGLK